MSLFKNTQADAFEMLVAGRTPAKVYDAELEALARVTAALRSTEAITPRPDFAANLRERLLAEAEVTLKRAPVALAPRRPEGRATRRLAIGISATILVGGLAGVSAASQQSGPGDVLYPIKRSVEKVTGSYDALTAAIATAESALAELEALVADGAGAAEVAAAAEEFTSWARKSAELSTGGNADAVARLERFLDRSTTVLQQLSADAKAEAKPELAKLMLALKLIAARID